jgi:hypothetical protein
VCLRSSWNILAGAFFRDLEGEFQLPPELLAARQIELVLLDEELAVHLVGGIFDKQFILVPREDDADGWIIAFDVFLRGEVAKVEVHLADVVMLHLVHFEVDVDEAAEDAVVEDEVHPVMGVIERDAPLPVDEGKALAGRPVSGVRHNGTSSIGAKASHLLGR